MASPSPRSGRSISPAIQKACKDALRRLSMECGGLPALGVVTADGIDVAMVSDVKTQANKISALASTLVSVANAMTREVALARCDRVILETAKGRVLLMGVTVKNSGYAFYAVAPPKVLLGRILTQATACVNRLSGVLAAIQAREAKGAGA